MIGSGPKAGEIIPVQIPTHAAGTIDFESGVIATFIMSFDVWHTELPRIEIYGSEGTLSVPDPNTFGGPVRIGLGEDTEWREVPVSLPYAENSRGIGLSEMADSDGRGNGPIGLRERWPCMPWKSCTPCMMHPDREKPSR